MKGWSLFWIIIASLTEPLGNIELWLLTLAGIRGFNSYSLWDFFFLSLSLSLKPGFQLCLLNPFLSRFTSYATENKDPYLCVTIQWTSPMARKVLEYLNCKTQDREHNGANLWYVTRARAFLRGSSHVSFSSNFPALHAHTIKYF